MGGIWIKKRSFIWVVIFVLRIRKKTNELLFLKKLSISIVGKSSSLFDQFKKRFLLLEVIIVFWLNGHLFFFLLTFPFLFEFLESAQRLFPENGFCAVFVLLGC